MTWLRVHDQPVSGRRLRILNVIDDMTKACPAAIVDTSIPGRRVAREPEAIVARRGRPELIVRDDGAELTSNAMLAWTQSAGVAPDAPRPSLRDVIAPGQSQQNGICEAFNARIRPELPKETLFFSLDAARQRLARRIAADNRRRPHSAIGYQTPAAAEIALVQAAAILLAPLLFFAAYFGLQHAVRHLLETAHDLGCTAGAAMARSLPLALLTLGGIATLTAARWTDALSPQDSLVSAIFVALAALTVPHMLLVGALNRRRCAQGGRSAG